MNRLTEKDVEEAKRLREEGYSYREIGRLLGVTHGAIYKRLKPDSVKLTPYERRTLNEILNRFPKGCRRGDPMTWRAEMIRPFSSQ